MDKPSRFPSYWHVQGNVSRLMTKPSKWHVCPAKTQINLDIRPVWSESSLSARRKLMSLATHWAHTDDSDQTGRMSRLSWVFARHTVILLVLSLGGSCGFTTGRFMLSLALLFVLMLLFFSILLALWSPRMEKGELVFVHLAHLFVYVAGVDLCPSSLPLGVGGWLQLVIVALPGCFINVWHGEGLV